MQWKRFTRLLGGATGAVWLLCSSGIIFIGDEEDTSWFFARMALVAMLIGATGVSVWLFFVARREIVNLETLAMEIRLAEQEKNQVKKR